MRIERDAVGPLDPAQLGPAFVAQREEATVSPVDVEPCAMAGADVGDFVERVDRAGVDGPGGGDDQPWTDAVGCVARHRLVERLDRHAAMLVGRDDAAGRPSPPGDVKRLVDAIMGEARAVDRAASIRIARVAGGNDGGQVGDAATRGQRSRALLGKADDLGQPGGAGVLQPDRAGAGRREARIFIGDRRDEVADCRVKQRATRDVGHEARAGGGESGSLDALGEVGENLVRIAALRSEFRVEQLGKDIGPAVVGRRVGQFVEIGQRMVERLSAKHLPLGGVRLERAHRFLERDQLLPLRRTAQRLSSRAASAA